MLTFTRVTKSDKWEPIDGFNGVEAYIHRILRNALGGLKDNIINSAFRDGVERKDVERVLESMDWVQFGDMMRDAGSKLGDFSRDVGVQDLKGLGVDANLVFDMINERAVQYAENLSAQLVVQIQEDLRMSIRAKIVEAVKGNLTVDETSRQLREGLPLFDRWAAAVPKYRDRQFKRLIKDGATAEKARTTADAMALKYEQKLVNKRALMIARTETAFAAQEGTYASWQEGIKAGLIRPTSRKVWFAEPGACDKCAALKDQIIPWDESFGMGTAGEMLMPPAHPNCRCRAAMLPPEDK